MDKVYCTVRNKDGKIISQNVIESNNTDEILIESLKEQINILEKDNSMLEKRLNDANVEIENLAFRCDDLNNINNIMKCKLGSLENFYNIMCIKALESKGISDYANSCTEFIVAVKTLLN